MALVAGAVLGMILMNLQRFGPAPAMKALSP